jgi:hypothetical protein
MTKFGTTVLFGTLLVASSAGAADPFGEVGTFAISAERITSINHTSMTVEPEGDGPETTNSATNIALFTGSPDENTVYSVPRVAGDYFVIDSLSVGAALGLIHTTTSTEAELMGTSVESDGPTISGFLFSPRAGYAFMFQDNVGIWPKLGFTYVSGGSDEDGGTETSLSALALSLDVPLVFSPIPNVAFTAGPSLDLGLSGSWELDPPGAAETQEGDIKVTEYGLNVGMTAFF